MIILGVLLGRAPTAIGLHNEFVTHVTKITGTISGFCGIEIWNDSTQDDSMFFMLITNFLEM